MPNGKSGESGNSKIPDADGKDDSEYDGDNTVVENVPEERNKRERRKKFQSKLETTHKESLSVEEIEQMKVAELKTRLKKWNLSTVGAKPALRDRLKAYLRNNEEDSDEEDEEDEESDESDAYETDEEEERKTQHRTQQRGNRRVDRCEESVYRTSRNQFTIKDVEDSIAHFTGDDKLPIRKWLQDFEDLSMLLGWNDLQKLITAL